LYNALDPKSAAYLTASEGRVPQIVNASGGETNLTLDETIEKFTQLLPEYKRQLLETII
jgi:hypothetical protein